MINFGNFQVGGGKHDVRADNVKLSEASQYGQFQGTATGFNDSMFNQSIAQLDQKDTNSGTGLSGLVQ